MSECSRLKSCPFFHGKLKQMPAIAEMAKNSYCRSSYYDTCARFIVALRLGPENVPEDLYPNQTDRVESMLKNGRHTDDRSTRPGQLDEPPRRPRS